MAVRKAGICKWLLFFFLFTQAFISRAQLTANFSATPISGCAPLLVNFIDLSTGNPTSWKWDLGNGTISFLKNPAVTYFVPGQYNVKLTVTNAGGTNEITKSQFITVYAVPVVNFAGSPLNGCYPLPVQFNDQSNPGSGSISKWEWDLGDGNLSAIQSPAHTYLGSGNFNVSLRVTNSFGCVTTLTKPQYLQIGNGAKAGFTFSAPNGCTVPSTVTFINTSTGSGVLNYLWDFGDGTTATSMSPSHTYTTGGIYTVTLIVINSTGCTDTLSKINAIRVGSVKADFSTPAAICQGTPFTFTNTSSPVPANVSWDFGDGTGSIALNPPKTFNTTGNFTIKMVASFGACADSVSRPITVFAKPVIALSADKNGVCRPPLTVNFSSTATGATIYSWDFGDGTFSSQQNPTHTYTTYGSFDVKLVATNASGCSEALMKPGFIKIQSPSVSIPGLPVKDCAPLTHLFSADVSGNDPVVSYSWDFGDGTTSNLANPSHTFAYGNYTVKVIVTTAGGCSDTATVVNGIMAGNKPHINFIADPRDVCAHLPVNFTDLTPDGDKWFWHFGDGTSSTDENPKHPYQDTGYFTITLVVWNNGCSDSLIFKDYVHIKPPIAIFEIKSNCSSAGQKIFIDHSIGADTWSWDFGDGTTSTAQNPPPHNYTTGTYDVTLTVTNATTGCSYLQTQTVNISTGRVDFFAMDTAICKNSIAAFKIRNIDTSSISAYYWYFGDGGQAAMYADSVTHQYVSSGKYPVTLIVTYKSGCIDTIVKPLYISVTGPTASFKSSVPGICLNNPITFTDNSIADGFPIVKWIWNFGDSSMQTFTAPPFVHLYSDTGTYAVMFKIVDANGCSDSISYFNAIQISQPVADFNSPDTLSCQSHIVSFIDSSRGPNLTYSWNFGDGITSVAANPFHQYAAQGIYTVSLTIIDQYGCTNTMVKNNYITIVNPIADFSLSDTLSTCPPLVITFANLSKNFVNRSWDFGDGTSSALDNPTHFYSIPGKYNIVLTVTGYGGCINTKTKQVVVRGPTGSFVYNNITGCNPLTTNFIGTIKDDISFIWDFNDGATSSTKDSVVSHTYTNPGYYVPKMILVDKGGCQVPILGPDTIRVYGVKAAFATNTQLLCDSGYVTFTDQSISNDSIASYQWNFGDGSNSAQQNPVHSYAVTGTYFTQLKVTTKAGCTDTTIAPTPIKIVAGPKIGIASTNGSCVPASVIFTGKVLNADTSSLQWNWDFGNGKTSVKQTPPPQIYFAAGSYTILAKAMNSSGCKDSATTTFQAFPLPVLKTIADTILCLGQAVNLTTSGASTYDWFPSTGLSCSSCANPVAKPDSNTQYRVRGTSVNGCIGWDTVSLAVRLPFKMQVSKGDTLCVGKSAQISASGASNYVWAPAAGLSNPSIANPIATPASTTNYMVVGKDDKGCFRDSAFVPIRVFPYPTVDAGADKTINVGQTTDLDPVLSTDVINTQWTPTSGIFRNRLPGITVKPPQTTEYTVEVSNAGGCRARDKVTVYVLCNNANVFIPNTFSPNGNGANDVFYPRGTGVFSIKTFRIFNRWGEVVFEKANFNANDASSGWDGTFKGAKLNPDVFVYTIDIICENNTILSYKGNIALIR